MDKIIKKIEKLNNPRLGSFGEYLFAKAVEEETDFSVWRVHRDRVDFRVGDRSIDVKTTRRFIDSETPPSSFEVKQLEGVDYAFVIFHKHGVRVCSPMVKEIEISWEQISNHFGDWIHGRELPKKLKKNNDDALDSIKSTIKEIARKRGYKARPLHRTVQAGFGKESPHNLIPNKIEKGNITVYIDFIDQSKTISNIRTIYALPDIVSPTLQTISKPTLHHEKIDLEKIPRKYVFKSLSEFQREFDRIL